MRNLMKDATPSNSRSIYLRFSPRAPQRRSIELFEEGAGGFGFCGGGVAFGFGDVVSDIGESGGGR